MSATYPKISTIVSSQLIVSASDSKGSIPMAVTVVTKRGSSEPQEFYGKSGIKQFIKEYGDVDLNYGKSGLYAKTLLESATDHLVVTRATSATSKFSGVLIKGKIGEENLTDLSKPFKLDKVVSGIGGLRADALAKYTFPLYSRDAEYSEKIYRPAFYRESENTNVLYMDDLEGLKIGDRLASLDDSGIGEALYTIREISEPVVKVIQKVTVEVVSNGSSNYTVNSLLRLTNTQTNHTQPITNLKLLDVVDFSSGTTIELTVPSSDYFEMLSNSQVKDVNNNVVATVKVKAKDHYEASLFAVEFDKVPASGYSLTYKEQIKGKTEFRDVALVVPRGEGVDGDKISIEIRSSRVSATAFTLVVYYDGLEVETHSCSPIFEKDGNGRQIQVDEVVNKNSRYIKWISNKGMTNENNEMIRPLNSSTARWLQNPKPHYLVQSGITLVEDVNIDDVELKFNSLSGIALNDRIVLVIPDLFQSKEYKVKQINTATKSIILDRPIEETKVMRAGLKLAKVDVTYQDHDNNIYDGYTRYPIIQLVDQPQPNKEDKILKIGDKVGKVLDAGANNMRGGYDGNSITTTELIKAVRKMANPEEYVYFFLGDSGFTQSAYQVELIKIAKERKITHAFLSSKLSSEFASDVVKAVSEDFIALNYSGSEFSFSTDWYKMTEVNSGRTDVMMPPSLSDLLVEASAISTDGIWTASAGWRKGRYFNNGLVRPKDLGERELLYSRGINTSKVKKFKGVAKFSDLTGLNQDRPLQFRSIAKLGIYIVYNLLNYIEDIHFEAYDKDNIEDIEGDIEAFLDSILSAGGIYSSQVVIGDLVNDTDVNMRKLPIYIAINGKAFFQGVTLGIDIQQGTKTEVNLAYARTLTA
jgi:hypothetical protein